MIFSSLATGLDDTVSPERALKYGIKLHRRTVAKTKRRLFKALIKLRIKLVASESEG